MRELPRCEHGRSSNEVCLACVMKSTPVVASPKTEFPEKDAHLQACLLRVEFFQGEYPRDGEIAFGIAMARWMYDRLLAERKP